MIKKYIKVAPVEAIRVTHLNYYEVREFAKNQNIVFGEIGLFHTIETPEGYMEFNDYDYIIKNQTGECYPCAREVFKKTYREVEK
ncbi:hypothetical protein SAMN04487839_11819 [Streptococcus gallolyticus]|uniref:Uncharacterized protein n=1 Tax=Streptococcus gallolyticus TaxID=315405 RepID=A0A1H7XRT5_9STRE|nr:hypothetical protein [Streptococcus gallolyticus]SEF25505.1 hypothetical protein SAMN02910295_0140 [Streptococcus gallolyticus]SEM36344.1 hypothetical protein SAMN04487839_11819 [Streptococcus gallolyticus]